MGRNRTLGAPLQIIEETADFQTEFTFDVYLVNSPSAAVTATLDPNADDGDQVQISDVGGQASTNNITINASAGQTIVGQGSSLVISANYGTAVLTFSEAQAGWIVDAGAQPAQVLAPNVATSGAAPTVVAGSAGGSTATASLVGTANDTSGTVRVAASGSSQGAGTLFHLTFATPYATAPKVMLTASSGAASLLTSPAVPQMVSTTGFFVLVSDSPIPGSDYDYTYLVLG